MEILTECLFAPLVFEGGSLNDCGDGITVITEIGVLRMGRNISIAEIGVQEVSWDKVVGSHDIERL